MKQEDPDREGLARAWSRLEARAEMRGDRIVFHNPARPYALAGLAVGLLSTLVLALRQDRGTAEVVLGILLVVAVVATVLAVLLALAGLGAPGLRRAAASCAFAVLAAVIAGFVISLASTVLDLGLSS
ncbi:MAG: hypothetical protein WD794_12565 [Mycobacteriales bacterium]